MFQEANLVLWQKFREYQEGTNFFAWACQIIRHKAMKHREKRAPCGPTVRPPTSSTGLPNWPSKKSSTSTNSSPNPHGLHLNRPVPGDRELMRQRYVEAMRVQAMAASMNRSPNAVSKSLGPDRRLLLECITSATGGQDSRSRLPGGFPNKGGPAMRDACDHWEELDVLLDGVLDGIESKEERRRLNEILRTHPEAWRRFVSYMSLHGRLVWGEGLVEEGWSHMAQNAAAEMTDDTLPKKQPAADAAPPIHPSSFVVHPFNFLESAVLCYAVAGLLLAVARWTACLGQHPAVRGSPSEQLHPLHR